VVRLTKSGVGATGAWNLMTGIFNFEMNVPAEVALKDGGPGKPIEGRYGNRVMYTLSDDRVMYVPPRVASKISDLGVQAGEVFQVCKQLTRQGQRRFIDWQVQRLETQTQLEHQLRESIEFVEATKSAQPSETAEATHPQPLHVAETQAATPVAKSSAAVPSASNIAENGSASSALKNGNGQTTPTTKLEHALKTAISAAHNAEKYGAKLGYVVRFDADAIKSMAITVLINMSQGSRR
jgi:hypothetical protein